MNKIDMKQLVKEVRQPDTGPDVYAPPAHRDDVVVAVTKQITSFGALPTKEIDVIIEAAEAEVALLKTEAQKVRDRYIQDIEQLRANTARFLRGVKLSMDTMQTLREQCEQLDGPVPAKSTPPLPAPSLKD